MQEGREFGRLDEKDEGDKKYIGSYEIAMGYKVLHREYSPCIGNITL